MYVMQVMKYQPKVIVRKYKSFNDSGFVKGCIS